MAKPAMRTMSGVQRAAILLMALGEKDAAQVLKHMGPKEVQELGLAMASMADVSTMQMETVMNSFVDTLTDQTSLGIDSDSYIRAVLTDALGHEKAEGMIDRILLGRNSKGLEQLKWMEPRSISQLIQNEHPQIIAIVLSYLDSDQSAAVLSEFPQEVQTDIIMRISTLEGIQPTALQELDEILEKQFATTGNVKSSSMGGVKAAANILNLMKGGAEGEILEQIGEIDQDLSHEIQDNMFLFENLIDIDDRGMQSLLREIASDQLLLAIRGADNMLKEKIFSNMSKRAAEMLRDDLAAAQPARVSDVEGAQREILNIARRMADAGELNLGGASGGEEYI